MLTLLAILGHIAAFLARESRAFLRWVRQMALLAARAARALAVWVAAHVAARTALSLAALAAFEAFTVWVTTHAITPLANGFLRTCIPEGTAGDGIVWMLWDTGVNGRALFSAFVVYMANYTLLWKAFDTWLRGMTVALSAYRASLRNAQAVRDASILK